MRAGWARWTVVAAAVVASVTAVALVRGAREGDPVPAAAADPGPIHVHGLGVNPRDGALFIATHTGLYRLAPGAERPARVGTRRQDTMGFTVVGPDRFLGSGHPDARDDLPPLLGLIESTNAGKTWSPVSLLGEADFHVLRALGRHVYGFDVTGGRLMISRDGGSTWSERDEPASPIDLAPDPANPAHLVLVARDGVYESRDEGATWQRSVARVGLLTWPARGALYLVDGGGSVFRSADGGRRWQRTGGSIGGPPAAFTARTSRELYAAVHEGPIVRSRDGGVTWVRAGT